jgi:hypothetical protein
LANISATIPESVIRVRARGMITLAVTPYRISAWAADIVIATMPALAAA